MAKKVKLEDLGKTVKAHMEVNSALEYKATAFEVFSQVIQKTPVDTGRARANWNISTGTPEYATSASTSSTPQFIEVTDKFPTIYIANGLDYVAQLEAGRSDQAPSGFMNQAIAAARANRGR